MVVSPESAGWAYASLRFVELADGEVRSLHTGPDEMLVLPLAGSVNVSCDGQEFELRGRPDV